MSSVHKETVIDDVGLDYECAEPIVPIEEARRQIAYDPKTGEFTRLKGSGCKKPGPVKTTPNQRHTYRYIGLCRKKVAAHRLAWLLMTGKWPSKKYQIDHVNRDRLDNRWRNLRLVNASWNQQNSDFTRSGHRGVSWHKACGKWQAYTKVDGKHTHLGLFGDLNEAREAYLSARKDLHLGYTNRPNQTEREAKEES